LVKTAKIVGLRRIGKVKCLDLKMKSKHHNFICEGLVTSNSHAVSYAFICYQTAWLKCFYRQEFMSCVMSECQKGDKAKIKLPKCIHECKKYFEIETPDVNYSTDRFELLDKKIIFPFTTIKGVGDKAVDIILFERKKKFKSFENFFERINKRVVNVGILSNIILADAFRKFGKREEIFDQFMELRGKDKVARQLYCNECNYRYPCVVKEDETPSCPSCGSASVTIDIDDCQGQKFNHTFCENNFVFGFNVKENPLKKYLPYMLKHNYLSLEDILEELVGNIVKTIVMIKEIRKHVDKNNREMAFIKVGDLHDDEADLVIFGTDWEYLKHKVQKDGHYKIKIVKDQSRWNENINNLKFDARRGCRIKKLKVK